MAESILATLHRINRGVALVIGAVLLICAGVVLIDIILRQIGSSFGGTDEISGYVMAIATSWGMAFTMLELGHVRIDLLRTRVKKVAGRVLFDLGSLLILAGTVSIIAFQCWPVVEGSLRNGSRANTVLETPLWMVQVPWFAGWVWFALMAWAALFCAIILAAQGKFGAAEAAIGTFGEQEAAL
jgi:TRAP-type C4-dicarboxylate transport system permease small subunit